MKAALFPFSKKFNQEKSIVKDALCFGTPDVGISFANLAVEMKKSFNKKNIYSKNAHLLSSDLQPTE